MSTNDSYNKEYCHKLCFVLNLGSVFVGMMLGQFGPVIDYYSRFLFHNLSSFQVGFITASLPIGAIIGSVFGSKIMNTIGRKQFILIIDIIAIIGTLLAQILSLECLIFARIILGMCVGFNMIVGPLFLSETLPDPLRTLPGTLNELSIVCGILVMFLLGFFVPGPNGPANNMWRVIFILPGIIATLRSALFFKLFNYDTPKYLIQINQKSEALEVLQKIYTSNEEAENKLDILVNLRQLEMGNKQKITYKDLLSKQYKARMITGIFLSIFQQLTGINCVTFYSNKIFKVGLEDPDNSMIPKVFSFLSMLVNLFFIMLSVKIVKLYPRKTMLVSGVSVMGACLFFFWQFKSFGIDSLSKYVILIYMAGYSLSMGPVAWVVFTEIVPDLGMSIIVFVNWGVAMIIGQFFPVIVESFGLENSMVILCLFCIMAVVGVMKLVKETKGKTKEEIVHLYNPDGDKQQLFYRNNAEVECKKIEFQINDTEDSDEHNSKEL